MTKKVQKSVFLSLFLVITLAVSAFLLAGCTKTVPVEGAEINYDSVEIYKGQVVELDYTITPKNANNYTITLQSSDPSIVSFNSSGYLIGENYGTATVTLTIQDTDFSDSCLVTVGDGKIERLILNTTNAKSTYYAGQEISADGITVVGVYQSGKEVSIPLSECTVDHNRYATEGAVITISYQDAYPEEFGLNVIPDAIEGLEITAQPTKTEYLYGETFDQSGLKVALKYRSGKTENVTAFTIENGVIEPGQTEIVVKYNDYSTTVAIKSKAERTVYSIADIQSAITDKVKSVMLANGFTSTLSTPLVLENVKDFTIYSNQSANLISGSEIIPIKIVGTIENVKLINFTISSTGETPAVNMVDFTECSGGSITFKNMTFSSTQTDALLVPTGNTVAITFSNCTYTKNA